MKKSRNLKIYEDITNMNQLKCFDFQETGPFFFPIQPSNKGACCSLSVNPM